MLKRKHPNPKIRMRNQNKLDPYGEERQELLLKRMLTKRSHTRDFNEGHSQTSNATEGANNIYVSPVTWHKSLVGFRYYSSTV
jgi:hypothetical protein